MKLGTKEDPANNPVVDASDDEEEEDAVICF